MRGAGAPRGVLASAAAAWWVWVVAIGLAVVAIVGLAKRRNVYVLLRGEGAEPGQRHLGAGVGKRKNTDKDSELV